MSAGTIKVVTDGMYRDINRIEKISANFYNVVVKNITDNSSISLINVKRNNRQRQHSNIIKYKYSKPDIPRECNSNRECRFTNLRFNNK